MRRSWYFPVVLLLFLVIILALWSLLPGRQADSALFAEEGDSLAFMPALFVPDVPPTPTPTETPTETFTPTPTETPTVTETPTPTETPSPSPTPTQTANRIGNGSFEDGWDTIEFGNQKPVDWALNLIPAGGSLFGASDKASGLCECVHKTNSQLPPNEQLGGPDALILDGDKVYKIFSEREAFGTELSQTLYDMTPGSQWRLTVPVQVHLHGDTDDYAAETRVLVNGVGDWSNGKHMGDRNWCKHEQVFTVPGNGQVKVDIQFKSKWLNNKDFFIDDVHLLPSSQPSPYPDMDVCQPNVGLQRYRDAKERPAYYDSWLEEFASGE